MKVIAIFALLIATSFAGVVHHTRCGGVGTFHEMRCTNCQGATCDVIPGTTISCEGDLTPSSAAPALRLRNSVIYMGIPVNILDVVLENSSVQPGQRFTVRFSVTPNDGLIGNTLPFKVEALNNVNALLEVCVQIQIRIMG